MECMAAVVTGFNQPLELRKVKVPDIDKGAVLIKIDAATLCGTDVHFWHGRPAYALRDSLPYIPGHEMAGTIVEMGGPLTDLLDRPIKVGDRVIASYTTCGHCYYCTVSRQTVLCPHIVPFGRHCCERPPYLLGGCSEYHYYPPGSMLVPVPDEVSPALASSASCALRTVMHGYERLGELRPRDTVLVQGCGPVGLYAAAVARARGARKVLVIGAPKQRLAVAKEWGADDILDLDEVPDMKQRLEWARDHTDGRGPDVIFQCATAAAIPEGLQMLRRGGHYVSIGGGGGDSITIPADILFFELTISTVAMAEARHFYEAIDFIAARHKDFPFEKMLTNTYTIDQMTEALRAMEQMKEVKPIILPTVRHGN